MSILGHGIDLVECSRIARVLERHEHRFLDRILTPDEQERARRYAKPLPFIAGRWAAKEAILKMIGTGWQGRIAWTDMEILPDELGKPTVALTGATAQIALKMGIEDVRLSISHTEHYAAASAIGLGRISGATDS
ncbi:MAG: holo-ACP synthase [Phycisphaerae bacterium]